MPDTKSIGLGGGSIVDIIDENQGLVQIRSQSVEFNIRKEALVFGGRTLVTTDIAVSSGIGDVGDKSKVAHLNDKLKDNALQIIKEKIEEAIDSVKLSKLNCPVILVGGGSILVDENMKLNGSSEVIKPPYYLVANAIGAALSKVSGTVDTLVTITDETPRKTLVETAKQRAIQIAVRSGALQDTCQVVEVSEIQMSFMAVPCFRLKVKVVGDLEKCDVEHVEHEFFKENNMRRENDRESRHEKRTSDGDCERTKSGSATPSLQISSPSLTTTGDWILTSEDADCLGIGAEILGCGGGGSPYQGRLRLKHCIEQGLQIKVIHPLRLKEGQLAIGVAFMGAPEIIIERISNGRELPDAIKYRQRLFQLGFKRNASKEEIVKIAERNSLKVEESLNGDCLYLRLDSAEDSLDVQNSPVISCEIGGLNAIEPLLAAARLSLPVLDCDGMGRAFPKLQHFAPFIYGTSPYPAVIIDHNGNNVCCVHSKDSTALEDFFRAHCVNMGCAAGVCVGALSREDIISRTCLYTLSQAWYLGHVVMSAQRNHVPVVDAIIQQSKGKLLARGKITDVIRETKDGFTFGRLIISGVGRSFNQSFLVEFQNEYVIAKLLDSNIILATVPDLITIVDADRGEAITTDEVKYGLRVCLLVLPVSPLMRTERALKHVGPQGFSYADLQYHPTNEYVSTDPIPQL